MSAHIEFEISDEVLEAARVVALDDGLTLSELAAKAFNRFMNESWREYLYDADNPADEP